LKNKAISSSLDHKNGLSYNHTADLTQGWGTCLLSWAA